MVAVVARVAVALAAPVVVARVGLVAPAVSAVVRLAALVVAYLYGGLTALALCAILGILEVSLSFDNAVVNAASVARMVLTTEASVVTKPAEEDEHEGHAH